MKLGDIVRVVVDGSKVGKVVDIQAHSFTILIDGCRYPFKEDELQLITDDMLPEGCHTSAAIIKKLKYDHNNPVPKTSLMCSLFGHKMVPQRGRVMVCERCDHTAEWDVATICWKFGHNFGDKVVCERCKTTLTPANCKKHDFVVVGVTHLTRGTILQRDEGRPISIRHYRCKCGEAKSDDPVREHLEGLWWVKDGKLMAESEVRAQDYTIIRERY